MTALSRLRTPRASSRSSRMREAPSITGPCRPVMASPRQMSPSPRRGLPSADWAAELAPHHFLRSSLLAPTNKLDFRTKAAHLLTPPACYRNLNSRKVGLQRSLFTQGRSMPIGLAVAFDVAFGGKADIAFCNAHVRL